MKPTSSQLFVKAINLATEVNSLLRACIGEKDIDKSIKNLELAQNKSNTLQHTCTQAKRALKEGF